MKFARGSSLLFVIGIEIDINLRVSCSFSKSLLTQNLYFLLSNLLTSETRAVDFCTTTLITIMISLGEEIVVVVSLMLSRRFAGRRWPSDAIMRRLSVKDAFSFPFQKQNAECKETLRTYRSLKDVQESQEKQGKQREIKEPTMNDTQSSLPIILTSTSFHSWRLQSNTERGLKCEVSLSASSSSCIIFLWKVILLSLSLSLFSINFFNVIFL